MISYDQFTKLVEAFKTAKQAALAADNVYQQAHDALSVARKQLNDSRERLDQTRLDVVRALDEETK